MNFLDSQKGWVAEHVIISKDWEFSTPDPYGLYPLNHTLKLPSKYLNIIYSIHSLGFFIFSFFFLDFTSSTFRQVKIAKDAK